MSIWPAGGVYPPPPRSRSRSPYAQRAPYPDAAYNDPYRNDWETYERERGYGDRYDYAGRRGRSRSPLVEECVLPPLHIKAYVVLTCFP